MTHGMWLIDRTTISAGIVASFHEGIFDYIPATYIDQFEHILAVYKHVRALPGLQEYFAQHTLSH